MAEKKVAVCLGSSGAVGQKLLDELLRNPAFGTVLTLVRNKSKPAVENEKLVEHVVTDMNRLEQEVDTALKSPRISPTAPVVGFSTLGVGHSTGSLTIDAHRAVDVELNRSFAKGLTGTGRVKHMVFMSAYGANPKSYAGGPGVPGLPRYNRVKGEAEEAVKDAGFDHVSIFRPATIFGNPHTPKILEYIFPVFSVITPSNMLSVHMVDLAKSMCLRGAQDVDNEAEKSKLFFYGDMMKLIESTSG